MGVSFILMTVSVFLCAFGPQTRYGFWNSYTIFVIARFLIACATRGMSVSGFVLGSEIGENLFVLTSPYENLNTRGDYFFPCSWNEETSLGWDCHKIFLCDWSTVPGRFRILHPNLAHTDLGHRFIYHPVFTILLVRFSYRRTHRKH